MKPAHRYIYTSLTRIMDTDREDLTVREIGRDDWRNGDYVVGEVLDMSGRCPNIELPNGRIIEVYQGDLVVGALGRRSATLEAVGDWESIGPDLRFEALTPAGLFGKTVSSSVFLTPLMSLVYRGHVTVNGRGLNMHDCIGKTATANFDLPVILIVGTSMSAGKTTTGKSIVHQLKELGYRVAGVKFTGAARYRDVLTFADAGADYILDFVDGGLPSTVTDREEFVQGMRVLLAKLASLDVDVVVAEAGASPLEPYNGSVAIELLSDKVRYTVLCASDPYAVAGVASAFEFQPDLVAGGAANTSAGRALVKKLTGFNAVNLLDPKAMDQLRDELSRALKKTAGIK